MSALRRCSRTIPQPNRARARGRKRKTVQNCIHLCWIFSRVNVHVQPESRRCCYLWSFALSQPTLTPRHHQSPLSGGQPAQHLFATYSVRKGAKKKTTTTKNSSERWMCVRLFRCGSKRFSEMKRETSSEKGLISRQWPQGIGHQIVTKNDTE